MSELSGSPDEEEQIIRKRSGYGVNQRGWMARERDVGV